VEQSKDTGASARAGLFVCLKCGEKVRDPKKRGSVGWVGWSVLGILAYVAMVFATVDITTRAFVCAESVIIAASVVLYLLSVARNTCALVADARIAWLLPIIPKAMFSISIGRGH